MSIDQANGHLRLIPMQVPEHDVDDLDVPGFLRQDRPARAVQDTVPLTLPDQAPSVVAEAPALGAQADTRLVADVDDDLGSPLPEWMRSRASAAGLARKLARRARYHLAFHAVRTPVYAARWTRRTIVGLGRAIRAGWTWAFDLESQTLRRTVADAGEGHQYLAIRHQHHHRVKVRLWASTATAAATVAGLAYLQSRNGFTAPGAATAAITALGIVGRPADGALGILDHPDVPLSVELTSDHLDKAFRAAGLLDKDASLVVVQPIMRDALDIGYTCVVDLPRGGGRTAAHVLAKKDVLAAELGIDEVQLMAWRIRAGGGGHAGRIGLWVADDDPYIGDRVPSPMAEAETVSLWDPIPFGRNARGNRIGVSVMWHALFIGGLPRRGKSFAQRLIAAAAVLDPSVWVYCADGKGGKDWKAVSRVARRYVSGAEAPALKAFMGMLAELIVEMERRFSIINGLSDAMCPEGKLTPEIARRYDLPPVLILIDELQEFLSSLDKDDKDAAVEMLCRLARRAPAAGFVLCAASQRPDADSVPTKLREIIDYRFSVQCKDATSSDMVLGKGMAAIGANAALLAADHLGVGVLVTGPADFDTVRTDYLDLPGFSVICERGRAVRQAAGTLSGDAAGQLADLADPRVVVAPILTDCLSVMRHTPTMHTAELLVGLAALDDSEYGDLTPDTLAKALEAAGVVRSTKQVRAGAEKQNLAGYRRADLESALPATWTAGDGGTEGTPTA